MKLIPFIVAVSTQCNVFSLSFASSDDFLTRDVDSLDRRFTCTVPGYTQCPQAGLPNNFCCPSDHVCLSLGASFTILCCPAGSDCSDQSPISCDIEQQNATAHPESLIKTTDLSSDMFNCGSGCCPFGFNCSTSGNCSMFAEQKQIIDAELSTLSSTVSSTSSSSSAMASSTLLTLGSSTAIAANTGSAPAPTNTTTSDQHSISFSVGALAGGIAALVLVIASVAGFLFWFYTKKRKSKIQKEVQVESTQETRPQSSSRGSFRKAELGPESSRTEMDASSERRELNGSSLSSKSKFSMRELEGDAAHEVSGENQIHEMDAGVPKERSSWL
jgi:hypothetical protein